MASVSQLKIKMDLYENVLPGDMVYLIPQGVFAKSIDDMVQVTVSEVIEESEKGCFVEGFSTYYSKEHILMQQEYKGKVGYCCSAKNPDIVFTKWGKRRVATVNRHKCLLDISDQAFGLMYLLHASEDIYVKVPICGNIAFTSKKDAVEFSRKLSIGPCLLQQDGIFCTINHATVVFTHYIIYQKGKQFEDWRFKEDLFQHMCNVETPFYENEFHMPFSKKFLLKPVHFIITNMVAEAFI